MSSKTLLKGLLSKLHLLPKSHESKPKKNSVDHSSNRSKDILSFELRLDGILKRHESGVSDHVYLIDLSNLHDKLSERWQKEEGAVHDAICGIIEKRLGENDLFIQYEDWSYMVVFPILGVKEGQLKTTLISEEVVRKLMGEENPRELVEIKAATIEDDGGISFRPAPPIETLIDEVSRNIPEVENAQEAEGGGKGRADALFDKIGFIFRPMLALNTKVVSTFMMLPIRPISGGFLSGHDVVPVSPEQGWVFKLDKLIIRKAAETLDTLKKSKKNSLVSIPVHFETLAHHNWRTKYIELCTALLEGVEKKVVFEIVGLPDGVPQARVLELVTELHTRSRSVIARFDVDHTSFPAFKVAGLHAVGIDIYKSELSEDKLMKKLSKFVSAAKKNQLKTYILGVRTLSMYTIAVSEGVDYMAGYALSETAKDAQEVYAFKLDMPYLSLVESAMNGKNSDT